MKENKPKNYGIKIATTTARTVDKDTLLCFVRQQKDREPPVQELPWLRECLIGAWQSEDFSGKKDQLLVAYPPKDKDGKPDDKPQRIIMVGLGPEDPDEETLRQAGGVAMARLLKTRAVEVALLLPKGCGQPATRVAAALSEGMLLAAYRFRKYFSEFPAAGSGEEKNDGKEESEEQEPSLRQITIQGPRGIGPAVRRAVVLAEAVCRARDMANEPGNGWTPEDFASHARQLAHQYGLKVTVLDRRAMEKKGMGGILAVTKGSEQPPRLVVVEYHGRPASSGRKGGRTESNRPLPTLLLVGKGLTFDSGGISLKPGSGMEEMKYDMCGGAAVLAAMDVVAREKPEGLNVVAMVPAAENLPGPAALKPGDVIRQYGGKSVEVINTDAEGRLILADALAYGVEKFKPSAVIDLATLTGAVIVALGHHRAGLLGNDDDLCARVMAAGERVGEPCWRLPLGPEYRKQLKSLVADLKNVDKRDAGTILGAAFLEEFVGKTPWVHLDIAGTAWNFTEKSYIPKGPSGFGVRTLVELIRNWG